MIKLFFRGVVILVFFRLLSSDLYPQLYKLDADNLRLIYIDKNYSYLVPHTGRTFLNAMDFHMRFWNYKPEEKVSVLLNDFTDNGNGGTSTIPWNFISIGIAPFDYTFDILPANERMQWLMSHELAHTVMTDKASSEDKFYRKILSGKVITDPANPITMLYSYLSTPRWYSPRWFHEGIAVFMETWMSGGMGRVLGGYDEMVFRAMVKDSAYFYRAAGLETEGTTIDFQVGANAYLYGTRFVSYLANKFGVEKLKDFYSRTDSSYRFYAAQFKKIYSRPIDEEWDNWIEWEKEFQKKNLALISKYPLTEYSDITLQSFGSVSRAFYDKEKRQLIAAVNYPGDLAHIISLNIDSGASERLAEVETPVLHFVTSLAYCDSAKVLYSTNYNMNWRSLNSLNIRSGKEKELIKYSRTGDMVINKADKSLWGIQNNNARSAIVRYNNSDKNWETVYTVPFGQSFFDIDISSNGKYLSGTMSDAAGDQRLIMFRIEDLMSGSAVYDTIYTFEGNSASNFIFSNDNEYLIGTSYYTGVSNIFRINIKEKNADLLTNTDVGFFRPIQISDDSLVVFRYTTKGLQPCKIKMHPIYDAEAIHYLGQSVKDNNPVIESWMLPPPSSVNIDSMTAYEGEYSEITGISLTSAYPIVEGYKDFLAYGVQINFMDPLMLHSVGLSATYTPVKLIPAKERIHLNLKYNYWNWEITAGLNKSDFYDIFGPTKYSRTGYFYSAKYRYPIIFYKPVSMSLFGKVSAYGDLEKLPDYQNINSSFDKMYTFLANLNYSYYRKSLGAVEYEQGYEWNINSYSSLIEKEIYAKLYANFDMGLLLPVRNSSLWVRTSVGNAFGDRNNPFNNFYFGGFGNNYIDHLSAQRYREMESLPGIEINEIGGKNFGKLTLEWNLPPIRFRSVGFLSFYSTYARFSIFSSLMTLDFDSKDLRKEYFSAGTQLDFELVLFTLLKSNLSFGYARAFNKSLLPSDEFMVSLKIM